MAVNARIRRTLLAVTALTTTTALLTSAPPATARTHPPRTERVSTAADGTEGDAPSHSPSVSADGRYVAFDSEASSLVPGDTNDAGDVFVRDLRTGVVLRAGLGDDGRQAQGGSRRATLSAGGRHVAFSSRDAALAPGERPSTGTHVYVRDLRTGRTEAVSVGGDGAPLLHARPAALSADGRYAAFIAPVPHHNPHLGGSALYLRDRERGTTEVISQPLEERLDAPAVGSVSLSADGRYVAFGADAPRISTRSDAYVRDRVTGELRKVDRLPGDERPVSKWIRQPSLSADGRYLAYLSYRDGGERPTPVTQWEVFVHDLRTGRTVTASTAPDGGRLDRTAGEPQISPDGRYVAYATGACATAETGCRSALYLRDLRREGPGATRRISVAVDGGFPDRPAESPALALGGHVVAFASYATNLVPGDTNGVSDVFVRMVMIS
ncbi:TolB family protein [Streptomyces rectiverticillatus]|uniref:TolB family protein n=1 Tax=Streptomyces rectiverticillatus TaxID=173860 RepID=UPI0015C2E399|nr:PD40 domain-containing protein [Streptomyces rectiverticillatus]